MNKDSKYIEINKLSHLHNGSSIFFCKTDYLLSEFENIKNQKNNVILITGNSDHPITDHIVNSAPKNIKKWYAQNALSNSPIIEPLPIGLENKLPSIREDHGIGYFDRATLKEILLESVSSNNKEAKKLVYANFNVNTNSSYRNSIKEICQKASFIDWEEPDLTLDSLFDKIIDYKMIVCPAGNGIDTHRLWEILYCNRIPITFKAGKYKIYELYQELPIIILNDIDELLDPQHIEKQYQIIKQKQYNHLMLDVNYWISKIKN
jgi:hypothetical protein